MNLNDYQKLVLRTATTYDDRDKEIANWGLGIAGEAGDVASCIKKTIYHKNDQTAGVRENLGDTMWYLAMICNFYGWKLEDVLAENIEKLRQRYPEGFTEKNAARGGTMIDWGEK